MTSKQTILNALKHSAVVNQPMPNIGIPNTNNNLLASFEQNLNTVAGNLIATDGKHKLQQAVQQLTTEGKQVLSLVDGVEGNRPSPATPHEMQDIDFTVLEGQVAVAENGAIWVSLPQSHRVTPFICENLIITIKPQNIVQDMHQAIKVIAAKSCEFGVFIAGPSKTADIEQALVVGAHGACSLDVYLV